MPENLSQIDSAQRLTALDASGLLAPGDDPILDRLTRLACSVLDVPVALISLVDRNRQFFKSHCGLPEPAAKARQTPLSHSFCKHVVISAEPLLISDAREHPLVRDNLAIRDLGVIAYAGVPIVDANGYVLGALCAIDVKPRQWPDSTVTILRTLSAQVSAEIVLLSQSEALAADLARQRASEAERRTMLRLNLHDLRTPLNAMLLGMEAVQMLGPLNPDQADSFKLSKRNGDALLNIINNLLDINIIEQQGAASLQRAPHPPCGVIRMAAEQITPLARERRIQLSTQFDESLPSVLADGDKLIRVLVNLMGNSVKFTPEGGHVEVRAFATVGDVPVVQFMVRDSGIGIHGTEDIFGEGVFLDKQAPSHRSTGLGLTFCKRIVEAHGGQIWFKSNPGAGSTFQFTIPAIPT